MAHHPVQDRIGVFARGYAVGNEVVPEITGDVAEVARAVAAAGADGLSLVNTLRAVALDRRLRPVLARGSGGLSIGGSNDFLYAVGVSADGQLVAAGGEEGIVRLYNGANGKLIKALLPPRATTDQAKK